MNISISVRNLVEFILRNGDIDNRRAGAPVDAMQQGTLIHRKIQKKMGSSYNAEVVLKERCTFENYDIIVEGRADGIYTDEIGNVFVDEIKGTYREISRISEADILHLAQAKCYAYIYLKQNGLENINVRITYCNLDTEEIRYFYSEYDKDSITEWFLALINEYKRWTDAEYEWNKKRTASIKQMAFPFEYREGQKELVTYSYQTIYHGRKLFIEAPTGVGKTISTIFPAIKAMGESISEKIFYLTAKTITRTVAENTFNILREKGLRFKNITLTAKEKICFCDEVECNPVACPYAKGHFDRVNEAIYEIITNEEKFDRQLIENYARKYEVCPFEFSLDVSLFADAVIGDYNYLFDPHVYLKRFFSDEAKHNYTFLIDEAHNLVDRGRGMYSAALKKEDFLELKRIVSLVDGKMAKQLEKCNKLLLAMKRECVGCLVNPAIEDFAVMTYRLAATMDDFLEEHEDGEVRKKVLEFFFEISHFNMIYELMDDKYVTYAELNANGEFVLNLYNVDPSKNLQLCMERGRASILFSATLLPIQYYKSLLGGAKEDYEVYAKSTFDPEKRGLFIGNDVTTKYTKRSDDNYKRIAEYILKITGELSGNYMVFFPSHYFLSRVFEIVKEIKNDNVECIVQESNMSEEKKEAFLDRFVCNNDIDLTEAISFDIEIEEKTLIGFCVMGGLFAEGIDLKKDALIGAIIVGTGLPQVCNENEILKNYFDEKGQNGFDYAYRFPGMNKVLQAAGRVIRTHEDIGVVALLDDRFLERSYQKMFPREWEHFEIVDINHVGKRVGRFWDQWLF